MFWPSVAFGVCDQSMLVFGVCVVVSFCIIVAMPVFFVRCVSLRCWFCLKSVSIEVMDHSLVG